MVLILDLMAPDELKDAIETLRFQLFEIAAINGFSNERTIQLSQRLDLYLTRYNQISSSTNGIGSF